MDQRHLYTATMVLDSVSPQAIRLSTMHVHMPRIILAEFNTHRAFSRNARSTRAVPTHRLIDEVYNNPYIPLKWLKNKPGMQGGEEMLPATIADAAYDWRRGARQAANISEDLFAHGLHKQWAGRPLEPYMWVDVLVSSTDWTNFMALRDHGDAQPEIELVAQRMRDCLDESEPKLLQPEAWHLPYIRDEDWKPITEEISRNIGGGWGADEMLDYARRISAARCARLSIKAFGCGDTIASELDRFDRLITSRPVHASPTEHQATPDGFKTFGASNFIDYGNWCHPDEHGNFRGWRQHRRMVPFNTVTEMPPRRH